MKKIFTLLCIMLFAVQFASAQKSLYVISKSGKLAVYPANKVIFGNDLFAFTYGDVTKITEGMFAASFSVAFKSDEYEYKSFVKNPEVGICFSDLNESPTIADGKIKKGSSLTKYTFSINGLDAGTTYYYRAYVKVNDAVYYGEVQSQTTFGTKPTNNYIIINGHKFVDLGLPSGLLWATCNVGAVTAADDGNYYAWGETTTKTDYSWSTYQWTSDGGITFTKYTTDGKTVLDKEDDAAYVNWGSSCRMPTNDEFTELRNSDNCTWTWTSQTTSSGSSIYGYKVTSVKNGNSIFLPASGYRHGDYFNLQADLGNYYWSSSLYPNDSSGAYYLSFGGFQSSYGNSRFLGHTVRPVAEQ